MICVPNVPGGIALMLILDYLLLNRLVVDNLYDILHMYAFGLVYVAFNMVYTLVPGATDDNGNEFVYEILAWKTHPVGICARRAQCKSIK